MPLDLYKSNIFILVLELESSFVERRFVLVIASLTTVVNFWQQSTARNRAREGDAQFARTATGEEEKNKGGQGDAAISPKKDVTLTLNLKAGWIFGETRVPSDQSLALHLPSRGKEDRKRKGKRSCCVGWIGRERKGGWVCWLKLRRFSLLRTGRTLDGSVGRSVFRRFGQAGGRVLPTSNTQSRRVAEAERRKTLYKDTKSRSTFLRQQ